MTCEKKGGVRVEAKVARGFRELLGSARPRVKDHVSKRFCVLRG